MKNFNCTFGLAHKNADHYEVVLAESEFEACLKMSKKYGNQWAFCYDEEQRANNKFKGHLKALV